MVPFYTTTYTLVFIDYLLESESENETFAMPMLPALS